MAEAAPPARPALHFFVNCHPEIATLLDEVGPQAPRLIGEPPIGLLAITPLNSAGWRYDRGNAVAGLGIAVATKKAKKGLLDDMPASNSSHAVKSSTVAALELTRRAVERLSQRG